MSPFSMFVVYLLIWWVVLFAVLPIGITGQAEAEDVEKGTEPGAPVNANIKKKAIITTIAATIIWVIVCGVIMSGLVDWRGNLKP